MRIAFGTDERTALTETVVASLRAAGHEVAVVADGIDWPDAGRAVGEAVASGRADRGVVTCTTGTGVAIAANKVRGVRAALCTDAWTAAGARRWNDANVLALSLRLLTDTLANEIVEAWLGTVYAGTESESLAAMAEAELERP
jgi:ribose 5-phosphate isomerase B